MKAVEQNAHDGRADKTAAQERAAVQRTVGRDRIDVAAAATAVERLDELRETRQQRVGDREPEGERDEQHDVVPVRQQRARLRQQRPPPRGPRNAGRRDRRTRLAAQERRSRRRLRRLGFEARHRPRARDRRGDRLGEEQRRHTVHRVARRARAAGAGVARDEERGHDLADRVSDGLREARDGRGQVALVLAEPFRRELGRRVGECRLRERGQRLTDE